MYENYFILIRELFLISSFFSGLHDTTDEPTGDRKLVDDFSTKDNKTEQWKGLYIFIKLHKIKFFISFQHLLNSSGNS